MMSYIRNYYLILCYLYEIMFCVTCTILYIYRKRNQSHADGTEQHNYIISCLVDLICIERWTWQNVVVLRANYISYILFIPEYIIDENTSLHKLHFFLWRKATFLSLQGNDYLRYILGSELFFLFEIVIPKFIRLQV